MENAMSDFFLCLHRLYVLIRFNISDTRNIELLEWINESLTQINDNEWDNEAFKAQLSRFGHSDYMDIFANLPSYKCNNRDEVLKFIPLLVQLNRIAATCIGNGKLQQAYAIIDGIHGLPELVISKDKWNARRFAEIYLHPLNKYKDVADVLKG